jgi:hypothetical protein
MVQHYCHSCAIALGIPATVQTDKLLDSQYQLDKFLKHTAPGTTYQINSIFADPGTASYAQYVVNTAGSGWYQVDDQGRHSMAWYAGSATGAEFRNGGFYLPANGIRLVCYSDEFKIHAFPDAEQTLSTVTCERCGRLIPYET